MNMKALLIGILTTWSLQGVFTLERAQRSARAMQESPRLIGSVNLLNPDYSAWYRQQSPSYFSRIISLFGIKKPVWSPNDFTQVLTLVTADRERSGYSSLHDLVINPRPGSEFVIVGPLYGAFHSLVRILSELAQQGMIDNEFKIIKPDTFFVFTGNLVDKSPVNMETLTVVMSLMKANPSRVICIAGNQELGNNWLGYGLKRELSLRTGSKALEPLVSQFFATLPRALFIIDAHQGVIKIGDTPSVLQCSLLKGSQGELRMCPASSTGTAIPAKTLIVGESRLMSYRQHPGLIQAPSQEGALTWSVFSAPNYWHREYFSFNYDAYVILTIGQTLAQSVLSLYNQDVRELNGFQKVARYGVMSGKNLRPPTLEVPADANRFIPLKPLEQLLDACRKTDGAMAEKKAEKEPLYIGCSLDLTKGASPLGTRVRDGVALCINKINAEGGMNGRPIQVVFMDDEYAPEKARQNIEEFTKKYGSNLFLCNLGSPTLQTYLDLVTQEKIFVFFPITGAPIFRQSDVKGIVHWRASYKSEAQVLTQYMVNTLKIRTFAFLYQNDSYGLGALEGSNLVMKRGYQECG